MSVQLVESSSRRRRDLLSTTIDSGVTATVLDQDNENHTWATISVGEGQGLLTLIVSVAGQNTSFPVSFAPPNVTFLDPNRAVTKGGANLTLHGTNFGTGSDFEIIFNGPDDSADDDDYTWSSNDDDDGVVDYTHTSITFLSPEGAQSGILNVTLTVADQTSDPVSFSFEPAVIYYLADDVDYTELGTDCNPRSSSGCGLTTAGGYDIAIVGENFGVDGGGQTLWFDGVALASSEYTVSDHTLITFTVPQGTGVNVPVVVQSGRSTSNTVYFSYDPPYITQISPNEPDAAGDTLEICESHPFSAFPFLLRPQG